MLHPRPAENPADSVMTQCLGDKAKLSGDLPQLSHPPTTSTPSSPPTTPASSSPPIDSPRPLSVTPKSCHRPLGYSTPPILAGRRYDVFLQVRTLPGTCVLLVMIVLLNQPAMGKPWIVETTSNVTFNVPYCRPLSTADLRRMMGPAFDEKRMAADMASAKRTFDRDLGSEAEEYGFQSDDPRANFVLDRVEVMEDEKVWVNGKEEEEDVFMEGGLITELGREEDGDDEEEGIGDVNEEEIEEDEEAEGGKVIEQRQWLPRRVLNRHSSHRDGRRMRYSKHSQHAADPRDGDSPGEGQTVLSHPYDFMRRRRRSLPRSEDHSERRTPATTSTTTTTTTTKRRRERRKSEDRDDSPRGGKINDFYDEENDLGVSDRGDITATAAADDDDDDIDDDEGDDDIGIDSLDKKSKDSILPLRLILSGKNKKLRRQLKKKFRQKTKNLRNKDPPWECKMTHKTLLMRKGVFPPVVNAGECSTKKCFYRLYNCEPSKYVIKLLQRDPDHCNPIPSLGESTVYEERWNLIPYPVTVGCNCASVSGRRTKYKGRR